MALDALEVIERNGLNISVIGVNGSIQYVERGQLNATLAQNPYDMGYLSVEQALKAIAGKNIMKRIDTGIDIITQDNAKDKLKFLTGVLQY